MYMPLILQAANRGIPVIDIHIPQQHTATWDRWLQMLSDHQDFLPLEQFFSLFDQPFHLSALHQNIIINDASPLMGQEIQEFIGSLNIAHNRKTQIWQNFNAAASEEHQAEVVAQSIRSTRQRARLVNIRSEDTDVGRDEHRSETHPRAHHATPTQQWHPVISPNASPCLLYTSDAADE